MIKESSAEKEKKKIQLAKLENQRRKMEEKEKRQQRTEVCCLFVCGITLTSESRRSVDITRTGSLNWQD